MSTVRTLRKLTRNATELARTLEALGDVAHVASAQLGRVAEQARQAPVRGRIERS